MAMMGMGQQQPMFGQRPQPAQMPQMTSDPFVQAWMAQAQQAPQAQQMQIPQDAPQRQAAPPPMLGQGAPGAQPGPQASQQPGQGSDIDWAKLLQLFVGGQ